ncbi:hypothetical protein, partial, partial [Absidia glauca]
MPLPETSSHDSSSLSSSTLSQTVNNTNTTLSHEQHVTEKHGATGMATPINEEVEEESAKRKRKKRKRMDNRNCCLR